MKPWARATLGSAPLVLVACSQIWGIDDLTFDSPGAGGEGGAGATSSSSATGGDGGGGAGGSGGDCINDADCTDGNPCTTGECQGGRCSQSAVAPGDPGTGEAPCPGTCQSDGACGLSLYRRPWPMAADDSFTKEPLSVAWSGPQAPPPRGILAAAHGHQEDWLLVFSDADGGTAHLFINDSWSSSPTSNALPGLAGLGVNSATIYQGDPGGAQTLLVTAAGPGGDKLALFYNLELGASAQPDPGNPYVITPDSEPDAGPQATVDADWELSVQTAFEGTPSWVVFWRSYLGDVYRVDGGDFSWTDHGPDVESPIWGSADQGGPSSASTVAAYHDSNLVYLVAP